MGIQVEGTAKVKVDGQEAGQQIEKLTDKAKGLRKEIRELRKQEIVDEAKIKKLQGQLKKTNQETRALKKQTFDYNKVLNNLSGASIKDLTRLQAKLNFETKLLGRNTTAYVQKSKQLSLVKAEMAKVRTEMSGVNKQGSMMGRMADGFNRYMGFIAGLTAAFAGVILGVRSFISSFNDFEERVDNLQALTGLAGDNLKYLEDRALSLSTTTTEEGVRITQSANDIVDGFTLIGSKRSELLKSKEALSAVTEDAIILSQAAKTQLKPAAEGLAISLNQFNASADKSRRFINAIAAGSQAGSADIPYLSKAIEKLGTTANLMNIEFEETIGVIEAVAPFYADASTAGNSLDKVLMKMKANQIGYKNGVFDLNTAIDELRVRFKKGESSSSIFGAEHAKMGELLVQNQGKFNEYTTAVTGTNTAIEQAVINTDNNNAKLAQAKNRTEESAIALGEKLAPALTISTNGMNYLLKALTHIVDNFGLYKKIIGITASAIAAYLVITKAATIAENIRTAAINIAKKAQIAFNNAAKANPWGLIIAVIVAAGAALIAFADELRGATKQQKIMGEIAAETEKRLHNETLQLNILMKKLEDSNITNEERRKLIGKINEAYGEYLPNLLDENASLGDIKAAYGEINKQLRKKLELEVKQERVKDIYDEILDKQKELKELKDDLPENEYLKKAVNFTGYGQGMKMRIKWKQEDIEELKATYEQLTNDLAEEVPVEALLKTDSDNEQDTDKDTDKDKLTTEEKKRLYQQRKQAAKSMSDYIENLNLQLLEDERKKAEKEVEIWRKKELEKIKTSAVSSAMKNQAVEAVEKLHKNKLTAIDQEFDKEMMSRLNETEEFIKRQNEALENDRQEIINREIERIAAKYDEQIKLAHEAAEQEGELSEEFAEKEKELEALKTEEINAYKLEKEREFAEEIQAIREEYDLVTDEERMEEELEQLKLFFDQKLITEQDYETARAAILNKYKTDEEAAWTKHWNKKFETKRKSLAKQQAISEALGDFLSSAKEAELAEAGDNEERKNEIMKRYADKEFIIKAAQISASTAQAAMTAYAQLGPIAGPIAAAIITATGLIKLGIANSERKRIKGLAQGGRFEVEREQDGRVFNAVYGGSSSGYYHKPTVLVGEEGTEYVVSNKALQVPEIANFVNAIERHRSQGNYQQFNYGRAIQASTSVRGYAEGGFTEKATEGNSENNKQDTYSLFVLILNELQGFRADLTTWQRELEVYVEIHKIRDAEDTINSLEAEVRLGS